ncbi:MAG: extracellular solute-binding protein [Treponema sp.]|jgi:putative spermidine/putrescine transport system substrate-binding protein|nr:extracellular solute-binding protein [Treponema sp.]
MSKHCRFLLLGIGICVPLLLAGCVGKKKTDTIDLNSLTMDELIAGAQKEGHIESVGIPDDWANWGGVWKAVTEKYGLTHHDTDMGSNEELATFAAEKDNPTRDMGDCAFGLMPLAVEMDVVQSYKPTTWDSIPDWAKDPDGRWLLGYLGTLSIIVNKDLAGKDIEIRSWQEFKDSGLSITTGEPSGGATQLGLLSPAFAFGNGLDDVSVAIEFWKEMARAGRIDTGAWGRPRFLQGETQVMVDWDYNNLVTRDIANENGSDMNISLHVLTDSALQTGYCAIINKYAPHPHASALMLEYALSDEGQLEKIKGYASPIRDISIPNDILAKLLPRQEYTNAIPLVDLEKLSRVTEEISRRWQDEVVPLLY